ncbi:MAG: D-alanyl-D-alanine carboxypeptidase, partial [Bacteroidaceae bacterium]|nr:D-alanyl-D-alanine carboxypeptidase [Bacteroidaceae bacterium]
MKEMKRVPSLLVFCFALIVSASAQDLVPQSLVPEQRDTLLADDCQLPWEQQLKVSLDQLAREADNACYNTGICVWDLTADSLLWGYNRHKVMRPASTQKVL